MGGKQSKGSETLNSDPMGSKQGPLDPDPMKGRSGPLEQQRGLNPKP